MISPNFAFLAHEFPNEAEGASLAESLAHADPRGCLFHCRHTLERATLRLYRLDKTLVRPDLQNLDSLSKAESFRALLPESVWLKTELIRTEGNHAVHGKNAPPVEQARQLVRELHHFLYWVGRTYIRDGAAELASLTYDPAAALRLEAAPSRAEDLQRAEREAAESPETPAELTTEIVRLRDEIAAIKAANAEVAEHHDYGEAETRTRLIDLELRRAGWPLDGPHDREYPVTGLPTGNGFADYGLWGDDGKPLAVIEAKRSSGDAGTGREQARLYADALEAMHGQRPLVFTSNGYETWIWDDAFYPPRRVDGFYKKDELTRLILRRTTREPLDTAHIVTAIVERYYQKRVIGSIGAEFALGHRKALLVMATGTGKTRTAIALVDLLQRAGWAKRVLFLADRVSLVKQAANAFKRHLPDSSPVNLVTDKATEGRVFVSTYPTMMGLIDETPGGQARFGPGYFDLVIIDEAHRSVYQRYRQIFRYFDSLLLGLTATPRDQVDKNTYSLFDLPPGDPTDAYELDTAVSDGFLVPPRVEQVDLKFPRQGIDYESLSEEERDAWESLDWGENADPAKLPDRVDASAINNWLFNRDTVDKALGHLMAHGHKVESGDRLGKTIIFARNHEHAVFLEDRFNARFPEHRGGFVRVIDNYESRAQSLIDDFSIPDKAPHIAISVDMLDTGIDVPEVLNLVFFKPVYSRIKFWQMIGRGTRLRPDLFAPGDDKRDFRIFDFCFNFDFFREKPEGIESTGGESLGARLFRARVDLLAGLQATPATAPDFATSLAANLHDEVTAMNPANFLVRQQLATVERFQREKSWHHLAPADRDALHRDLAGLPTETETDDVESRLFDLLVLQMQLAQLTGDASAAEKRRRRVAEIAGLLEEKTAIPAVAAQLTFLAALQDPAFWTDITLTELEDLRRRLRSLVPFLDRTKRQIVYTDFEDEILDVRVEEPLAIPAMTGTQYAKRVAEYLADHHDNLAIAKLHRNLPLTTADLESLERALVAIGADHGDRLLADLLTHSDAPSLPHFIRRMIGLDRQAAVAAFGHYLENQSLTARQIRFVELLIDQLTTRGIMTPAALYDAPFTDLHDGGPEAVFTGNDTLITALLDTLETTQPLVERTAA